jgi:hypothetical protein
MTELGFQTIVISDHIAAALSSQERARVAHASQAAEKVVYFVIPSEARNLSGI